MARYFSFHFIGNNVVLDHSNGQELCSAFEAEQKLLDAVHNWAAENVEAAREQMELLTALLRER